MKKQISFPRHTHFVGIPLPPDLEQTVFDCRDWMHGNYGCRSGYGTPPHITLVSPFTLPDGFSERDVFEAATSAMAECKNKSVFPLSVTLSGFGSFSERTLFINVSDSEQWQKAHSIFTGIFSESILRLQKKNSRKFYPHLSIANRDIPSGVMDEALKHFSELNLCERFLAEEVCVYKRTPSGGWTSAGNCG